MSEKRYLNIIPSGIQDTKTGKNIHGSKIGDLLNEQEETIQRLKTIREEQIQTILKQKRKIKELTAQLQTDEEDDICIKCKHHYLINYPKSSKYYISKCKKEHEECSKEYIRFCEDFEFELEGDVEWD